MEGRRGAPGEPAGPREGCPARVWDVLEQAARGGGEGLRAGHGSSALLGSSPVSGWSGDGHCPPPVGPSLLQRFTDGGKNPGGVRGQVDLGSIPGSSLSSGTTSGPARASVLSRVKWGHSYLPPKAAVKMTQDSAPRCRRCRRSCSRRLVWEEESTQGAPGGLCTELSGTALAQVDLERPPAQAWSRLLADGCVAGICVCARRSCSLVPGDPVERQL